MSFFVISIYLVIANASYSDLYYFVEYRVAVFHICREGGIFVLVNSWPHTTTAQYYRDVQREKAICGTEVQQLKEELKKAEEQLRQVKKEIKADRLKAVTTQAKTNIVESVGSLFGSNKFKALEQENKGLHEEVAVCGESIENLQTNIQRMQAQHNKQLLEIQEKHIAAQNIRQKEMSVLKKWLDRA